MLSAHLIDDEKESRNKLKSILEENCSHVTIEKEVDSYEEALKLIKNSTADIIFLDIELGEKTGFDLLTEVGYTKSHIIFITAYPEHASNAFRYEAIDYLVKPLNAKYLKEAIAKVEKKIADGKLIEKMLQEQKDAYGIQFSLSSSQAKLIVNSNDIISVEGDGSYSQFLFTNRERFLTSKGLKNFEFLLKHPDFHRVHQSHIANFKMVKEFIQGSKSYLLTYNNIKIPVARRKIAEVKAILRSMNKMED